MACSRQGGWFVADSANFHVCSQRSAAEAKLAARHCEALRTDLGSAWNPSAASWNPRCQVILYARQADYIRAVGGGSEATVGSSWVRPTSGPIVSRRIDLRTDVDNYLTAALPHELCHVVVADRFRAEPAPLWFDEGVALLYDPPTKQRLHERDLREGLERGRTFSLAELLTLKAYPPADRWDVFYGQSASLTRSLLQRGSPQQLLQFVERLPEVGVNLAIRESYALNGTTQLERLWRQEARGRQSIVPSFRGTAPRTSLIVQASTTTPIFGAPD